MLPRIIRIVAFGLGLAGGVIASQVPEFSQQYRQRLGGAIDELQQVLQRFDTDAEVNGETRETAIARLLGNSDNLVSRQAAAMQANAARLTHLELHRQTMADAGSFRRIVLMMRDGDTGVMQAAYRDFEPAVPVTEEGLVATAAGFLAVWGGLIMSGTAIRRLRRSRRREARA